MALGGNSGEGRMPLEETVTELVNGLHLLRRVLAEAAGRMELPFPETRQAREEAGWGWGRVRLSFRHVNWNIYF